MSDKIKDLVKQSTTDSSGKWLSLEDAERLVENIIKECAVIADKNSPLSYPDHGIKIKRHFGVDW